MPKASELKRGDVIEIDEQLFKVRNVEVRTPSSRGANTLFKVTLMNLQKQQKLVETYTGTDFLKAADCMCSKLQFLYREGQFYTFMDSEDYQQYTLSAEELDNTAELLPDGQQDIIGMLYESKLISVELPAIVSLKIVDTAPAIKGASASSRTKPATLETGLVIQVPEYLAVDEIIKVNTATGKFSSRS